LKGEVSVSQQNERLNKAGLIMSGVFVGLITFIALYITTHNDGISHAFADVAIISVWILTLISFGAVVHDRYKGDK
jgi:hypothetical protein